MWRKGKVLFGESRRQWPKCGQHWRDERTEKKSAVWVSLSDKIASSSSRAGNIEAFQIASLSDAGIIAMNLVGHLGVRLKRANAMREAPRHDNLFTATILTDHSSAANVPDYSGPYSSTHETAGDATERPS
jgi:hypothetical protein